MQHDQGNANESCSIVIKHNMAWSKEPLCSKTRMVKFIWKKWNHNRRDISFSATCLFKSLPQRVMQQPQQSNATIMQHKTLDHFKFS